ncbi:MAG: KTSC domain-containing protein [Vicinamibacterales bacterium]
MPRMIPVDSTSIDAIGYDTEAAELHVRLLSGNTYKYAGVSQAAFQAFLSAPSKGAYFNREMKPKYFGVQI